MKISIFTGGSGNANLISYLSGDSTVYLSLIINGYDDGKSTGIIRKHFDNMLGPSDFRKNFSRVLDIDYHDIEIKKLFEHRLSSEDILFIDSDLLYFLEKVTEKVYSKVDKKFLIQYLKIGFKKLIEKISTDSLLDFSLGNIIFAGMYERFQDFNIVLNELSKHFSLKSRFYNVTKKDFCNIIALTSGNQILWNEEDIVNYNGDIRLKDFAIVRRERINELRQFSSFPKDDLPAIEEQAIKAIDESDILIYGTGTLFSSLLPTYRLLSKELRTKRGFKVLLINNKYDNDIKNIRLSEYIGLITKEIGVDYNYFDLILISSDSEITVDSHFNNLVIGEFSLPCKSTNPFTLWSEILKKYTSWKRGNISFFIENDVYSKQFADLLGVEKIKNYENLEDDDIVFFISSTGRFRIDLAVQKIFHMLISSEADAIIGNRFPSRRSIMRSMSLKSNESFVGLKLSQIFSTLVMFLFVIRFSQFHPDPFSGFFACKKKLLKDLSIINYKNAYRHVLKSENDISSSNVNFIKINSSLHIFTKIKLLFSILK